MDREEVLEKIMNGFGGDESQKNALYAYITEATDNVPRVDGLRNHYLWEVSHMCFNDMFGKEHEEIIKRLIYALSEGAADLLLRMTEDFRSVYKKLKAADVKTQFVIKESFNHTNQCFNYYGSVNAIEDLEDWTKELQKYYPEVRNYLLDFKPSNKRECMAVLYTLADEVVKSGTAEQEQLLENWLFSIMVSKYGLEAVAAAYETYGKDTRLGEYIKAQHAADIKLDEEQIFCLCHKVAKGNETLREMARLIMVLFKGKNFHSTGNCLYAKHVKDLWKSLQAPLEVYLSYEIFSLGSTYKDDSLDQKKKACALMQANQEDTIRVLEQWLKQGLEGPKYSIDGEEVFILLGLCKAMQLIPSENTVYEKQAEEIIKCQMEAILRNPKNALLVEEKPSDTLEQTEYDELFAKLGEREISKSLITIDEAQHGETIYDHPFKQLALGVVGIMNDSVLGANLVKLTLMPLHEYTLTSLSLFEKYSCYNADLKGTAFLDDLEEKAFPLAKIVELVLCEYCNPLAYVSEEHFVTKEALISWLQMHKAQTEALIEEVPYEKKMMGYLLNLLYGQDLGFSDISLANLLNSKSKPVIGAAEALLLCRESTTRETVEALSKSKGKATKDAALRLIRQWDNERMTIILKDIHTIEDLVKLVEEKYTKEHDKKAPFQELISYANIREKDGDTLVPEMLIKYFVAEYILLKDFYVIKLCKKISEMVNPYDLQNLLGQLYIHWVSEGATTTYKNLMFPYALMATPQQLTQLKKQLDEWSLNGKPALAAFGVQCLCMNGSKMALLWTDNIAKKHKNKKVRQAAEEAMEALADEWQVSHEVLEDMIVPDFGFSQQRIRYFDYGKRQIKAVLNEDLSISLFDQMDKAIRSMPKASEKYGDEEEKAAFAKEEMKAIKKQLPGVFDMQAMRMNRAIFTGRTWSKEKWEALFVQNPIMLSFATGLIWEERAPEGELLGVFRYMSDGSLNDLEEEEYELQEGSQIALVHPSDLPLEQIEAWQSQLEDYEITQPIQQLTLPIGDLLMLGISQGNKLNGNMPEEDRNTSEGDTNTSAGDMQNRDEKPDDSAINLYKGINVYGATIKTFATKHNWQMYFGEYGECDGIYFYDEKSELYVELHHDSFNLSDYQQVVELGNLQFKRENSYVHLEEVPKRLISLALYTGQELKKKAVEVKISGE